MDEKHRQTPPVGENRLGTEAVHNLVIRTGAPLMLSLLINSLYNFVDSVFVSHISEHALTAVSLSAPVQILMSSLGCGIAVGLNAVISKSLGEKDEAAVKKAASAAIFLAFCSWLLLAACGLLFVKPYFAWQSGGNEEIARYGVSYLQVCMVFSLGLMGQWVFDRFVIASGRSSLFLYTLSAASITNLILDPLFIFGWLGLPAMGTTGAAVATVIGQSVGCIAGYLINRRFNREIPLAITFRPSGRSVAAILRVGLPTTLVQGVVSLLGIVMNSILIGFSTTAVAVYGVCTKIQSLATVGVHGIDNGVIPIVAFNYGAKKPNRISETVRWAMIDSVVIFALFLLALEVFPTQILRIFDASEQMLSMGIPALRILAVSWLLSIPCLVLAASFQGLGRGSASMTLTLVRQAALPLLLVLAVIPSHNLNLVWWAFVVSELLTIPFGIMMWKRLSGSVLQVATQAA